MHFIQDNVEDHIDAYWGGRKKWEALPDKLSDMKHFTDWNYGNRAKVDPFFAQVWNPLHDADEVREYPKEVSELDI